MDPKAKKFEKKAKTFDNTSKQESKVQTVEKSNVVLSAPEKKFHHKQQFKPKTVNSYQEKIDQLQAEKEALMKASEIAERLFKIIVDEYPGVDRKLICMQLKELSMAYKAPLEKEVPEK